MENVHNFGHDRDHLSGVFFDSKRGAGKVNNFGHDRYFFFGQKATFSIAVSLFAHDGYFGLF